MYAPQTQPQSPNQPTSQPLPPADPLHSIIVDMADPALDSRIAILTPGALELTCDLIRRGYRSATLVRLDDRLPAHQADIVIIPNTTLGVLERAIPFARRLLAPMGVLVVRLPPDPLDSTLEWSRHQLLLNGFTAIRVRTPRGETLIGAELPLHGRLACA